NLFIKDTAKHKLADAPKNMDSSKAVLKDSISIKKFTGNYISDDGLQINFRWSNKKLYADAFGRSFLLTRGEKDSLLLFIDPGCKVFIQQPYTRGHHCICCFFHR